MPAQFSHALRTGVQGNKRIEMQKARARVIYFSSSTCRRWCSITSRSSRRWKCEPAELIGETPSPPQRNVKQKAKKTDAGKTRKGGSLFSRSWLRGGWCPVFHFTAHPIKSDSRFPYCTALFYSFIHYLSTNRKAADSTLYHVLLYTFQYKHPIDTW